MEMCCGVCLMPTATSPWYGISSCWRRTLTPFGFQAEERTLWQAPETYALMSPFNQADKIKKPLLLIHGEADNNTGRGVAVPVEPGCQSMWCMSVGKQLLL